MARDIGFSPDLRGLDAAGEEELAEERCFRRSGRREGRETTMIAVHISAMLHTSAKLVSRGRSRDASQYSQSGTKAFCSSAKQRPMLTAIVIKPRPNVTQRAMT